MNLLFTDLDRAARIAAARAPVWLRADSYQEAWVRFMRYDPATVGGAILMGRHAVIDFCKRERLQPLPGNVGNVPEEADDTERLLAGLWAEFPAETEWLLAYYETPNLTGAQRTQASRIRTKIKEAIHEHV